MHPLRRHHLLPVLPLVLAAALGACGTGDASSADALVVESDTVGGVPRVRSRGPLPPWTAERVLSIGAMGDLGEPRPDEFGDIAGVVADAEGNVYVADRHAGEIRAFDAAGAHLRTMGRFGGGPGEFGGMFQMGTIGDSLAVLDGGNARIQLFTRDGRPAGTLPWMAVSGSGLRFYGLSAGAPHYDTFGDSGRLLVPAPRDADLLAAPGPTGERTTLRCDHSSGRGISFFTIPFTPTGSFDVAAPGRLVMARWPDYRFAVVDAGGDTLRIVERDEPPVPILDAAWDSAVAESGWPEFRERDPGADCDGSMDRPEHKAFVRHVLAGPGGETWVERVTADGFAWDVFDAEGRPVGTFPAPDRDASVPPYLRDDRLYLVTRGEMDVRAVEVLLVRRMEG